MKHRYLILPSLLLLLQGCTIAVPFSNKDTSSSQTTPTQNAPIVQTGGLLNTVSVATNKNSTSNEEKTNSSAVTATRAPSEGCTWEKITNEDLGISFFKEACPKNASPEYGFFKNQYTLPGEIEEGMALLTVFYKQGSETDEAVLSRLFLSKLSESAKKECIIAKDSVESPQKSHTRYQIKLTEEALKKHEQEDKPYFDACGPFGQTSARSYFEFEKDKSKFIFVNGGFDVAPVDLGSISLLK